MTCFLLIPKLQQSKLNKRHTKTKKLFTNYLIVAGLDHKKSRLMMLHSYIERCQRTSMFFGGVQQNWLVHCDPNGQPGPQSQKLYGNNIKIQNALQRLLLKVMSSKKMKHLNRNFDKPM